MHALHNTISNFKFNTNTKLYKIKYLILEQHYYIPTSQASTKGKRPDQWSQRYTD